MRQTCAVLYTFSKKCLAAGCRQLRPWLPHRIFAFLSFLFFRLFVRVPCIWCVNCIVGCIFFWKAREGFKAPTVGCISIRLMIADHQQAPMCCLRSNKSSYCLPGLLGHMALGKTWVLLVSNIIWSTHNSRHNRSLYAREKIPVKEKAHSALNSAQQPLFVRATWLTACVDLCVGSQDTRQ